jgi:hypothetical protein
MNQPQMTGLLVCLIGLAALIVSVGTAWTLSCLSRRRRVESAWFIILVTFSLFLVGAVLCYFGVTAIV